MAGGTDGAGARRRARYRMRAAARPVPTEPAHPAPPVPRSKRSSFGSAKKPKGGAAAMPAGVDILEGASRFTRSVAAAADVAAGISEWAIEVLVTQLVFPGAPAAAALAALVEASHTPALLAVMVARRLIDPAKILHVPAARPLLLRMCGTAGGFALLDREGWVDGELDRWSVTAGCTGDEVDLALHLSHERLGRQAGAVALLSRGQFLVPRAAFKRAPAERSRVHIVQSPVFWLRRSAQRVGQRLAVMAHSRRFEAAVCGGELSWR